MKAPALSIFEAVVAIEAQEGRAMPPGAVTAITRAIAVMVRSHYPADCVREAEAMAIEVSRLEQLVVRRDAAMDDEAAEGKRRLHARAWAWLIELPIGCVGRQPGATGRFSEGQAAA